ncbi:hypothetical protein [Nucisporomicrobium flavum]|uniref:hypothetical protein n=1 Tax=Nucisporomicrobium flavum TaxID=2785915 RepID=UPI0018F29613|nr:hypothetical protein [Nucisporomicrobium flavum]
MRRHWRLAAQRVEDIYFPDSGRPRKWITPLPSCLAPGHPIELLRCSSRSCDLRVCSVGEVERVEGAFETADGVWRVEVVRYRGLGQLYRVRRGDELVADRTVIARVEQLLGDAMSTLQPAPVERAGVA